MREILKLGLWIACVVALFAYTYVLIIATDQRIKLQRLEKTRVCVYATGNVGYCMAAFTSND